VFFSPRAPDLAALKRAQARLFGRAHTLLVGRDWPGAANVLTALASTEGDIAARLFAQSPPT